MRSVGFRPNNARPHHHTSGILTGGGSGGQSSGLRQSPTMTSLQHYSQSAESSDAASPLQVAIINEEHELGIRRPSAVLQDILSTRRPSVIMAAIRGPGLQRPRYLSSLQELGNSTKSINQSNYQTQSNDHHRRESRNDRHSEQAQQFRNKNRRIGDDALSSALSALYAKVMVILGVAMPVTEVLTNKIPTNVYQGFYVYMYLMSIGFVIFLHVAHMRTRAVVSIIKTYHETRGSEYPIKRRQAHFGSFYLRVGAISFGIGTMVYSGLEFGQYFEMTSKNPECSDIFIALTPAARMVLSIFQMQFIFLNTTELDMAKHKVIARFGLMHMVATNLCEWLYVLVEETKHEIHHFMVRNYKGFRDAATTVIITTTDSTLDFLTTNAELLTAPPPLIPIINELNKNNTNITNFDTIEIIQNHTITKRSYTNDHTECARTNIMGSLVQNASPFLFPCTIEYSLICAVILYEMWKKVKDLNHINQTKRDTEHHSVKKAHHFSVDCARAHRGMFLGILVIVITIICLIMYFVLHDEPNYEQMAIAEVTICEIILYTVTSLAVIAAVTKMRDLKFQRQRSAHHASSVQLDCTLLVLAQTGVYVYGMFSIMGSYFSLNEDGGQAGFVAEILSLIQTSVQTLFILNACWRRCRGAEQHRTKPGREIVTFLLVANMSMWFVNTLIKGRAGFRPTHLNFYGVWAWTVITHVSMPLAIFYRFHSTICLFEIWKSAYKQKNDQ